MISVHFIFYNMKVDAKTCKSKLLQNYQIYGISSEFIHKICSLTIDITCNRLITSCRTFIGKVCSGR